MPRNCVTSLEVRELIVKLRHEDKHSICDIANIAKKSKSVIHSILKKFEETGSCEAKKPPGRPRKTTAREDRWIVQNSKKDRFTTATAISKNVKSNFGINVSRHTVSRRLNEKCLFSRVPSTKPFISKKNKASRKKFATEHVTWTEEQWGCVHFSDESKFNLFGSDGRRYVRRNPTERYSPKCIKSSVKFGGGSVMVFGMISAAGPGPLVRLHGRINAAVYKELLKQHVLPPLRTAVNQPAVFMQDNAPCHTAKSVKKFFSEENVTVMDWPAQSPDLNPIENVWKLLNERTKKQNPSNVAELWNYLKEEWEKISVDECKTLINSCGRRCQAVIDSNGLHTKY